jgi:putative glutamine amidotransferase
MEINRFEAPSWHHQAVDELGDGLVAVGHAPDGIIEAIEMPEHPFMLGMQWHPELGTDGQPEQQRLFDALVRATLGD